MKKKLLVLGANGFLGKNLSELVNSEYSDNFELVLLKNKSEANLSEYHEVNNFFEKVKPNYVINCSAFVGGIAYGYKYPASILSKNIEMINNIFKSCIKNNIELLINPISNCAYPGNLNEYKEDLFWDGKPHDSVFNYALTRRFIVAMSRAYFSQYSLSSANIVLSNMYGPHDHFDIERSHALGALINKIYNAKLNNLDTVEVWGTGHPIREWLYVEDGAKALTTSLKLDKGSHLLNVGVNKGISIRELAEKIAIELGWKGKFYFNTDRPDGALEKRVDGEKFSNKFNWQPKTSLDEGLERTLSWYVKNFK